MKVKLRCKLSIDIEKEITDENSSFLLTYYDNTHPPICSFSHCTGYGNVDLPQFSPHPPWSNKKGSECYLLFFNIYEVITE